MNPDQITRIDETPMEQRSATANAALGILVAKPFLEAGADVAKDWAKEKLTGKEPPPKVELPPGAKRK